MHSRRHEEKYLLVELVPDPKMAEAHLPQLKLALR
jgi:hypothetical protein